MPREVLISLFLLFVSVIYYFFQPKKVNKWYGYRTRRSMKNIQNWQYSNKLAAILLGCISLFNTIVFSIILFFSEVNKSYFPTLLLIEFAAIFFYIEKKTAENEIP